MPIWDWTSVIFHSEVMVVFLNWSNSLESSWCVHKKNKIKPRASNHCITFNFCKKTNIEQTSLDSGTTHFAVRLLTYGVAEPTLPQHPKPDGMLLPRSPLTLGSSVQRGTRIIARRTIQLQFVQQKKRGFDQITLIQGKGNDIGKRKKRKKMRLNG